MANGSKAVDYLVPQGFAIDADGVDFRSKYPDGFLKFNVEEAQKEWDMAKEELQFTSAKISLLDSDTDSAKKMAEYLQGQMMANLPGLNVELNTPAI